MVTSVDVLKVDAEGADFKVLQGGEWEGDRRPSIVMCEFDEKKVPFGGHGWEAVSEFLASRGFSVWVSEWEPVRDYGGGHRWFRIQRYPCDLHFPSGCGNLLAVDPDTVDLGPVEAAITDWEKRMSGIAV